MCVNRYVKEYVYRVWHSGRQICTQDRFTVAGAVWIRVEADVKWAACSQEPLNTRKHCQCYSVPECVWLWPRDSLESWLNMHDYTSMNICLSRNSHCLLSFLEQPLLLLAEQDPKQIYVTLCSFMLEDVHKSYQTFHKIDDEELTIIRCA